MYTEEDYERLEIGISRYNDITVIMKKLKDNGFFQTIYNTLYQVFSSEHDFTLNMLSQLMQAEPQNQFKLNELYKVNANIFCNNFHLINKLIIEDIYNQFISKPLPDITNEDNNQLTPIQSRSNSITQENSSEIYSKTAMNQSKEADAQLSYNGVDGMNLCKLNQNMNYISTNHPQIDALINKNIPRSNSAHLSSQTLTPISSDQETGCVSMQGRNFSCHSHYNSLTKFIPPESAKPNVSLLQNDSSHISTFKSNIEKEMLKKNLNTKESKSFHTSYHFNNHNNTSTIFYRLGLSTPSKEQSQTKKQNETQDVRQSKHGKVYLPYSEFSYCKGGLFSKCERKIHQIGSSPGVGNYHSNIQSKVNSPIFGKQEKKSIFSNKLEKRPELYYPSHHFISKPLIKQ